MATTPSPRSVISIGLPVYNGANYIGAAIEAHLAQSYGDFELLISDNASTDNTLEICESYARRDSRIRIITSEQNLGATWNHKRVLANTKGELFRWAAADDIPGKGLLQECIDILRSHPDVDVVVPHTINIDASGTITDDLPRTLDLIGMSAVQRASAVLIRSYQYVYLQGLLRRAALMATSRRWNYFGWDMVLFLELALRGGIAQTEHSALLRRLHQDQTNRLQRTSEALRKKIEPAFRSRFAFPNWRWEIEYTRAIVASPISLADKRRDAEKGLGEAV